MYLAHGFVGLHPNSCGLTGLASGWVAGSNGGAGAEGSHREPESRQHAVFNANPGVTQELPIVRFYLLELAIILANEMWFFSFSFIFEWEPA